MKVFNIAINLLFLNLFYFSKNVSGLKRSSVHDKPSNDSFLQVKSTLAPENVQPPLAQVQGPQVPPMVADPEGVKKAVAASMLASQGLTPPNGPLAPSDVNTVTPMVPPQPVANPVPNQQPENVFVQGGLGEGTPENPLNVLLDPSMENISNVEKSVKNSMERAVHDLKRALEGFTNLSALLEPHKDNETFSVDTEEYSVKTALDSLNKTLRMLETLQKVMFQANAFVLKELTKTANGNNLNDNKNNQ